MLDARALIYVAKHSQLQLLLLLFLLLLLLFFFLLSFFYSKNRQLSCTRSCRGPMQFLFTRVRKRKERETTSERASLEFSSSVYCVFSFPFSATRVSLGMVYCPEVEKIEFPPRETECVVFINFCGPA